MFYLLIQTGTITRVSKGGYWWGYILEISGLGSQLFVGICVGEVFSIYNEF